MQTADAPRHFLPGPGVPGAGLPHDRFARVAARRAFVELKQTFLDALDVLPAVRPGAGAGVVTGAGSGAGAGAGVLAGVADVEWLRQQVRSAEEPEDLWLLRALAFAALAGTDGERRRHRQALRRSLDRLFPDTEASAPSSIFATLY